MFFFCLIGENSYASKNLLYKSLNLCTLDELFVCFKTFENKEIKGKTHFVTKGRQTPTHDGR